MDRSGEWSVAQIDAPYKTAGDADRPWFAPQDQSTPEEIPSESLSLDQAVPQGATILSGHDVPIDAESGPYFAHPSPIAELLSEPPTILQEESADHDTIPSGSPNLTPQERHESMLKRMGQGIRNIFTPHRPEHPRQTSQQGNLRQAITKPFRAVSQRAMELPADPKKGIPLPIAAPKGFAAIGGKVIGWPAPRSWANPVVIDSPQTPELVRSAGNAETPLLLSNGRATANGPVMSVPMWNGQHDEE
jgi:hypothetical protein